MSVLNHYTYRIRNIETNTEYIGVRSCKCEPEDDLGIKYFSSSSDMNFMCEQKNGDMFDYIVISRHPTRSSAIDEEISLHAFFNVVSNDMFYNKARQTSKGFDTTGCVSWNKGRTFSNEARENMRKASLGQKAWNKGKPWSDEVKSKISNATKGKNIGADNSFFGKHHSEEVKKKLSESCQRFGKDNSFFGKKHTEDALKKMREPRAKSTCTYCGKTGGGGNMKRYHFENCKLKGCVT